MIIRKINENEVENAMELAWKVFLKYEAPDYSKDGIKEFQKAINDKEFINNLEIFGAFKDEELLGIIAIRNKNHISLFFVDERYHKQGIGRKLYNYACSINKDGYFTVNSSPYAKKVYEHLGFISNDGEKVVNGIRFFEMRNDNV